PAIRARGWGWRHPGRKAWALRGLDLTIEEGERVLLIGASGAGKSTLLQALAGLLDRSGAADEEGELSVRGDAGLVLQDPETQLVMARSGDDVAFGLENRCVPTDEISPRVHRALADVGFPYSEDHATAALSGGEKQRLAIAGILALRPRVLLLDEPTANLDPEGARAVREVIARVAERREVTMVMVEHRIADALPLVDRVIVIEAGGGVVADGPPRAVFARDAERLTDLGVWVPGAAPAAPPRRTTPGGVAAGEIEQRVRELLERLDLSKVAAANPFTLSGGEKRRLSVGTALATSPGALVLDEPTFGQDRRTFAELLTLLAEYRDGGGAIAFASHDELFVDAIADERLRLVGG